MRESEINVYLKALDSGADLSKRETLAIMLDGIAIEYSGYEIADALLENYVSLTDITSASYKDLKKIKCLGVEGARILKASRALCNLLIKENTSDNCPRMFNRDEMADYLRPLFLGQKNEMCYACLLNARHRLIHCEQISLGNEKETPLNIKYIVRLLGKYNATSLVLAHNHLVNCYPSKEDIAATIKLDMLLRELEYKLSDHLIFFENSYLSMRDEGYIKEMSIDALINRPITGRDF